jgi:hypothetical protein
MGNLRVNRSLWTCLALVALVGNVIASAFCCAPSSSRRTEIVDPVLGAIPLCTTAPGDNGSGQPKGSKQHCPVCLASADKAIGAPTVALWFGAPIGARVHSTWGAAPATEKDLKLGGLGSRAPPLHA